MDNLITDLIGKNLQEPFFQQTGEKTGVAPDQTKSVVGAAIPLLLSQMAKNTKSKEGANSLATALDKKHAGGSIFNQLTQLVADPDKGEGPGILKHVLGSGESSMVQKLAKNSNLSTGSIGTILKIVAPIVMGSVGKMKKSGNLDSSQLSTVLKLGANQLTKKADENLLVGLIDKDGDGDIKDDLLNMGLGYVKNFFSKKA